MEDGISTKAKQPKDYEYILQPLSAECHVIMDQTSKVEMDVPKLLVEVIQQELSLAMSQKQFHNLMDVIDSFELMSVNQQYKKYQPTVKVHDNASKWWKYAYTAICEEGIRSWSWERIKAHRARYRAYKSLYKRKLKGFHDSERESSLRHLQALEDDLGIPSVLIAKQQAELEVPPEMREVLSPAKTSSGSWWSWLGGGAGAPAETLPLEEEEDLLSKLTVEALPKDEKEKLYKAIDYSEGARPIKYPLEYIKRRLTFHLDSCLVTLLDVQKRRIAEVATQGFAAAIEQRPGGDAMRFQAEVNGFQVLGTPNPSDGQSRPCLMSSKTSLGSDGKALLSFTAETNPLHVRAEYAVALKVEPVEIRYDNITVDKVIDFFDVPNYSKLQELEAAAANKLRELRSWTRSGLEYAIAQHKVTFVDMDVRSPYIVIPEYGNLARKGNVLIVDLGHLTVVSDLVDRDKVPVKKRSDDELAEMFYDKFDVKVTDVQLILAEKGSDWHSLHVQSSTPEHILPATCMELQAYKSISAEYPELPEFKAISVLPTLWIKLSDTKYKQLMQFLKNFPLGTQTRKEVEAKGKPLLDKQWVRTASTLSVDEVTSIQAILSEKLHPKSDGEDDEWFDSVEYLPGDRPGSRASQAPDRTYFTGEFAIHQLRVTLDKANNKRDKPYISLNITNLTTTVTVNTWDLSVKTSLGFIQLIDNYFQGDDGNALAVLSSSGNDDWISVDYVQADPKGPEFSTKFENTQQSVRVKFSSIQLTAVKEALAAFEIFLLELLESDDVKTLTPLLPSKFQPLETIEENEQLETRAIEPVNREVVDIAIEAHVEKISIKMVSRQKLVGCVHVKGLKVKIEQRGPETKIVTMLKDLGITNAMAGTFYPKILCLEDNTVFECEITLFDNKSNSVKDPLAVDVLIDLKIGRFKFVFLSGFTAHMQSFVQALISPETMSYAQNITQNALKTKAKSLQERGTKLGLSINVHAPKLVIPGHSGSRDMLVADLGNLEINNAIEKTRHGVLIDNMEVTLSSFEVRCFSEEENVFSNHLVEPIRLDIVVRRRLDPAASHIPLIEVDAVLELLQVNLATPDFKLLMMVINKNLTEGIKEASDSLLSPSPSDEQVESEQGAGRRSRIGSALQLESREASAHNTDDEISLKCNFNVHKVLVNSPRVVDGRACRYLILNVDKLVSTLAIDGWTTNVHADLGTIQLMDHFNKDLTGEPVCILSSSKEEDLITLDFKMADPSCPEFESAHCSVQQTASIEFRRVKITCPQQSAIDLQEHVLALTSSDIKECAPEADQAMAQSEVLPSVSETEPSRTSLPRVSPSLSLGQTSFKLTAVLWEVDIVLIASDKNLADINIKGLEADISVWDRGLIVKSTQRDLSITDLDPSTIYPKILSVENENVFDFEFKLFTASDGGDNKKLELKPDGALDLNVGRMNFVFLYRFIDDLMRYVEPLTSPSTNKYVQEAASKTVQTQLESLQSQGTRISLDVSITAPLVVMPRHSRSVDMLIADLGHLELRNEFEVFEMEVSKEKVVIDIMELNLQSVQLARGRMDLSNSSVVKRYLIEPIRLDATIKRSMKPSCHEIPFLESTAVLGFIKMNLGSKDYQLLTTITQENLNEGQPTVTDEGIRFEEEVSEPVVVEKQEAEAEQTTSEETTSAAESASLDEVWDYMVFSFELPGVSLVMYMNEKDLDPFDSQSPLYDPKTALCLCDVTKTTLNLALTSDNSVQLQGLLQSFIVDDIRPDRQSSFTRLIDKKLQAASKTSPASPDMCEVFYCMRANGDMEVVLQLQSASIFVNFPFIWPLLEFFTPVLQDEEKVDDDQFVSAAESQASLDAPPTSYDVTSPVDLSRETSNFTTASSFRKRAPAVKVPTTAPPFNLTVKGTVKQPDIVLLANPLDKNSEAIIVQTEVDFAYKMSNEKQQLNSLLTSLQMVSCQFPNVQDTAYKVLNPCDLTFKYRTPVFEDGRGQEMKISIETMNLQFSPVLLRTINDVVATLSGHEKVSEGAQTEGMERVPTPADLWSPRRTNPDHWFQKTGRQGNTQIVSRKSTGDKIELKTKEVSIVMVNETQGAHVPLLLVKSTVRATAMDYTAQMKLEADLATCVSFYNERLGAWEPLLEQVSETKENPYWELQLKVFFADSYVSSFTPHDQESVDGPPDDVTDAPRAHRWIPWQNRPRSESRREPNRKSSVRKFSRKMRRGSVRKSSRQQRRGALRKMTSDDEEVDDLDYHGAVDHFFLHTVKTVTDPAGEEVTEPPVEDTPMDEVDASVDDREQATYIVLNSHDALQLTVTPTALDVLTDLSKVWTVASGSKSRSIPGPTFTIRNELGIHALAVVSHKQKIQEKSDEFLTVRYRAHDTAERKMSLSDTLAAMAHALLAEQKRIKKRKQLFSEPLLNKFRDKFQKIQRRRASLPVGLEVGRGSEGKRASFEVGGQKTRPGRMKKSTSLDSGNVKRKTHGLFSLTKSLGANKDDDYDNYDDKDIASWKHRIRMRKNDLFALDNDESRDFSNGGSRDGGQSNSQLIGIPSTSGSVGADEEDTCNRVSLSIANVGTLVGGISSPQFSDTELSAPGAESSPDITRSPGKKEREKEDDESFISVVVDGYYSIDFVPITRSGRYLYKLRPKINDEHNVNNHVVVQVNIKNGQKTVLIRSPLQVYNHLEMNIELLCDDEKAASASQQYSHVMYIEPNSSSNVPLQLAHNKPLYIRPQDPRYGVCPEGVSWRDLSKQKSGRILVAKQVAALTSLESLESLESIESKVELHMKLSCQADSLNKTPSSDAPHHVIHLYPPIILHNLLPVDMIRLPEGDHDREEVILPGERVPIVMASVENTCAMNIKLVNLRGMDWFGTLCIDKDTGKTSKVTVISADETSQLVLGVLTMHNGTTDVTVYSPYWLINKTGIPVEYRVCKTDAVYYHGVGDDQPLLFNFHENQNRKARLRVTDSLWSKKFSLDAVGDAGLVYCRDTKKTRKFEFVLQIEMSQTGLTKIVTLTPKYVVINTTEISISYCEDGLVTPLWFAIEPDECKAFWPCSPLKRLFFKPTLSQFFSKPVPFNCSHTTVLRMRQPAALGIEVHGEVEESVTTILITPYCPGVGTIRVENLCEDLTIRYNQEDVNQAYILPPGLSMLYTWDDPNGSRRLMWKPYLGVDDALFVSVCKDDHGEVRLEIDESGPDMKDERKQMEDTRVTCSFTCIPTCTSGVSSPATPMEEGSEDQVDGGLLRRGRGRRYKRTVYWVSMLDGLQRVLLFTEDSYLATRARKSSECEPIKMEVFVSLDGVGLSLVNNKPEEVSYITLSSSTSIWQVQKSPGRWKTLNLELSSWLEDAWKNGEEQISMDETALVDFSRMKMVRPYEGAIRRSFEPAMWFHYSASEHYHSAHCKMHRIQIDNQLYGTVFPVVLYPAPLPPAVISRHGHKPFIEVSVIYHDVPAQGVHHFKYAKALVQEMNVKVDKSFIIALTSLLSKPLESDGEETYFKMDMDSVAVELKETLAVKAALQTQRVFLEYFHLSPLKVNLSFSLESVVDDPDQAFAEHIMDFFMDSIGATLIDMNDAQLKLAFFERVGVFITQENLQGQITRHYTMQGVRQVYALVLGLDVLGNPYALISGIGEGVRDLFYEPYQGIIYGPQEFAEGLARGVKSLLGHVVGGTAGAFSRITGSIGQAVATLTFDSDYRMKRRQRMHVEPKGVGQGLIMGGKSLVMGLVFGIGGVVMKPIEGARSEGVEGFFKGMGKGFLGLLTRPTGGVIDMVSFTLDGIRRSAEQGGEDIAYRMRLPRFTAPGQPVTPYSEEKAKGYGILKSIYTPELSGDVYVSDMTVSNEKNGGLVLLTSKRIIMVHQSRFWKEWKVSWMCAYDDVTTTPWIVGNTLVIKRKESESSMDVLAHLYEIESNSEDELKALKSDICNALRRYR
ncbi:intermembrane lipid transfer protein VPS13A-like isoform X2 [Nematostella vectensis]|nr:intermembrane lipid transfer protein VPS13A-like isoform X2 [Nematostella vectensis]